MSCRLRHRRSNSSDEKTPHTKPRVVVRGEEGSDVFVVQSMVTSEFVGALWCARIVHERAGANMEMVTRTFKVRPPHTTERPLCLQFG